MHGVSVLRIYVWELPVRIFHWVNAACITALVATGLMIGSPFVLSHAPEASLSFRFGIVRFIHFVAAWIFVVNILPRLYWGLVGNEHARFRAFIPLNRHDLRKQWKSVRDTLRVDIFQIQVQPVETVGHNSLAGWSYAGLFLVMLFQVASGFALYASMSESSLAGLFAWVVPLMGGDLAVRQWHHAATWVFVLFTMVHVYLVIFHDFVEGRGTTSSIVGGWKFIERHVHEVSDD